VTSTFRPVDEHVREEIRTATAENLLVEAGAGTGKTTVLVRRIVEVLRSGRATVDDVAVVTFTEKAATELAARVREGLEGARRDATDAAERTRLNEALRGLYRARIETLHAFATSLLRERPVEARVDPGLRPLDEVAASLLFDEVYEDWLSEVLAGADPALERALRRGFDLEHLRDAAQILDDNRAALPLAPLTYDAPDIATCAKAIAGAAADLRALAPRCTKPDEDKGYLQLDAFLAYADRVAEAEDEAELERLILFRWPRPNRNAGTQGNWETPDDCRHMKATVGDVTDAVEACHTALRTDALAGVLGLLQEYVARHAERRRTDGVATFDDLLLWARDMLRDDLDVRRYFQDRYRAVLVDEFQDTDPLQAEIALYLTSDGRHERDWRALRPAPGKLFVVGDPKQSIYRFRRADIAIYDAVKRGPLAGELRQIQQNFRSVGGVLAFVNRVFASVFGAGEAGAQAAHVDLLPTSGDRVADLAGVIVVPGDGSATTADEVRTQESERLAALLHRAVEVERWPVRDARTDALRPARWRDVAILMPTRTGLETLRDALEALEIPYRADGARGFFGTVEVRELVAILRAIDDPTDALSVFTALRSHAFGCSDEDIVRHATAGGRLDPRAKPKADTPEPVAIALRTLRALHRERRGLSLPELVRRTLDESGLVELALLRGEAGRQSAANLLKIVEHAQAFTVAGGGALRSFTRWLAQRIDDAEFDEAEAAVAEETDDVVRVMTVHAAKGLEYPIVALSGFAGQTQTRKDPIGRPDEHRVHFRVGTASRGTFATPGFDAARAQEKELLERERARLLYVALTRARDHLVVPRIGEDCKGPLRWLLPHLPLPTPETVGTEVDGVHVYDPSLLTDVQVAPAPPVAAAGNGAVTAAEEALEDWRTRRDEAVKAASGGLTMTTASTVKPYDRVRPLAAVADADAEPVDVVTAPPLPLGDAVHRALEAVSLPDASDLDLVVAAACAEAGIRGHEALVADLARRCLDSAVMRRALRSGRFVREIPFTVPVDATGFAAGRMDLVFEEGSELVIVDYKTDALAPGDEPGLDVAMEHHRAQAAVYAAATEQAAGRTVREVVMVFPRANAQRSVAVDEALRAEAAVWLAKGGDHPPEAEGR
jgi:ATP-dependent helicase/nuclease subunit A